MLVSTVFRDREGVKKKAREEKVAGVLAFIRFLCGRGFAVCPSTKKILSFSFRFYYFYHISTYQLRCHKK